jgi:transcriptional antiterminator NusG
MEEEKDLTSPEATTENSENTEAQASAPVEHEASAETPSSDAPSSTTSPESPASSPDEEAPASTTETAPEPDKGRWYVVHTYSGHEAKVAATLKQKIKATGFEKRIFEILVPTQEKIEVREGKKVTIQEKIFPGYILVRMDLDDETWYTVRSTAGVTSFVGIGNKPTPLDPKEVKTIQRFMRMEAPTYKASFSIDEPVKIIDGPFAEFLGTVESIDEAKGKVKVLVSIFGRETPVELDFLQVSKL